MVNPRNTAGIAEEEEEERANLTKLSQLQIKFPPVHKDHTDSAWEWVQKFGLSWAVLMKGELI